MRKHHFVKICTKTRKHGEQTGLDTQVVHVDNDKY